MSSSTTVYEDHPISPRVKLSALRASTLFVFVYVDLFTMYRADVRADIEAGKVFVFTIGQGVLLGMTAYILIPSLMVFLSLVLPVRLARTANVVPAALYAITIIGGAVGEWNYYILGSAVEVALLATVGYYAWRWPQVIDPAPVASGTGGAARRPVERRE